MIKHFKNKTLAGAFALIMGAIILIAPLTTYAANFNQYATVGGDGVRLRKTPSFNGTILELMYKGEGIWIDSEYSDNYWVHVKRVKTNTIGYMGYDLYDHQ
ncbi:hypothetical protein [Kineothrix sedimenti]|uniref:SH3 domain-containing protein n=1 Tax=Kineothrix sedimenti TaxID=3123317 RepID=A0ABZ3EV65_9FIRM